ncbi:MAG: hypothetical protein D6732_18215 [Methanobacteriota archaeon]|nr:MAG: hypothetical protein D6732_18215 [Euryarchaeota archaeon]
MIKLTKKCMCWVITISLLLQMVAGNVARAGEGPAQPEAAQFEPIDTSDLVNLYTGDFVYNVPLLEVPGPEGNWPIGMSYHAGVGPNTEATWVGLGWTLNPGAINRFVNGYPDDYWNGSILSRFAVAPQQGWGVGLSISYGPVGMSLSFDSHSGFGVNANLSVVGALAMLTHTNINSFGKIGNMASIGYDVGLQVGTSGTGISTNLGLSIVGGSSIGGSLGISANIRSNQKPIFSSYARVSLRRKIGNDEKAPFTSMSLIGVGFSSNSQGASFSVAGTGFQSQSRAEGSGHFSSSSFFHSHSHWICAGHSRAGTQFQLL